MDNVTLRCPSQPGRFPSHGLRSLWDMMTLQPIVLMNMLQLIINTEYMARGLRGPLPREIVRSVREGAKEFEKLGTDLDLPATRNTARIMLAKADTSEDLHSAIEYLGHTLFMEMDSRKFYGPLVRFSGYFEQSELFGGEVFKKFPSANNDIYEAGMCLALERGTACVMHLMRVVEVGLAGLAKAMGVGKQNDWGAYLRKIDEELERRYKTSGARSPDEQFYSEVAITIDQVRRAWRNPTMHVDHNYSPDRALEILESVKSFMVHLATKVSE